MLLNHFTLQKDMVSTEHRVGLIVLFAARAFCMVTVVLSPPEADVIENSSVTLTCKVINSSEEVYLTGWREHHAGSPIGYIIYEKGTCSALGHINNVSLFAWSCERNSTFTLTLKNVKRNTHNTKWFCIGSYQSSNASQILVRVPVESLEIKSHTQKNISILENSSATFECTATPSRPISAITWFLTNTEHLEIRNITNEARQSPEAGESINFYAVTSVLNYSFTRRFNGWSLYCQATNMLDLHVTSAIKLLDIMYPAEVGNLTEITVIEGSSINMTCPIIPGNPPIFSVEWKHRDLESSTGRVLYISNISRTNDDTYVCSVNTRMKPTNGVPKEHVNYAQFKLSVVYKAHVMKFYIDTETDNNVFTVNESDNVTFFCYIDSKPSPNVTIQYNGKTVHASGDDSLVYTNNNIQCADFGLYICSGKNKFNYETPSEKSLTLYINCSPRPSPFTELVESDKTARNTSVTLSFTALAYPEPGQSGFTWKFINGSVIISLSNSSKVVISSSQLQSNLTIRNVRPTDYGQYILRTVNSIGVYEQIFTLEPQEYSQNSPGTVVTDASSNTGTVVGVGVGTAVTTVIIMAIALTVFRRLWRRRKSTQIVVNDGHGVDRKTTGANADSETSFTYESLDDTKKEGSMYSHLPVPYEQLNQDTKEKSTIMENTSHDISDYVNVKI